MTDYSSATINTGNALAGRLVRAVGGGRFEDIVSNAALTYDPGLVTSTSEGFTFAGGAGLELPDTPLAQFTVFVLAYAYSGLNGTLISRSASSANAYNSNYALRLANGLAPRGQFKEDGTSNFPTLTSSNSGTAGVLCTAAFSYDGTNQEIYLDGVSRGTQAAAAPWTSTSTGMITQIGVSDGSNAAAPYAGLGIQLVLIFDEALTDAEIASLHADPDQVFNLSGGDTTAPIMTGGITVTNLTSTSYDLSWPAATDDVAVGGYEVSLNAGSSWTNVGNVTSTSVTGRTPSSTDSVRVRAFDTASPPNYSTPALAEEVTLLAPASPPVVTVVSTVVSGQSVTVEGTYTGDVTAAQVFIPAATPANGAVDVGPLPVTYAAGSFDVTIDDLPPGSYDPPEITMFNSGGSDTNSGSAFEILGIGGDPEASSENNQIESLVGAESTSATVTASQETAETVAGADTPQGLLSAVGESADAVAGADTNAPTMIAVGDQSDTNATAETNEAQTAATLVDQAETAGAADQTSQDPMLAQAQDESAQSLDQTGSELVASVSVVEVNGISEVQVAVKAMFAGHVDTAGTTESQQTFAVTGVLTLESLQTIEATDGEVGVLLCDQAEFVIVSDTQAKQLDFLGVQPEGVEVVEELAVLILTGTTVFERVSPQDLTAILKYKRPSSQGPGVTRRFIARYR